jgi:hypothetical protein
MVIISSISAKVLSLYQFIIINLQIYRTTLHTTGYSDVNYDGKGCLTASKLIKETYKHIFTEKLLWFLWIFLFYAWFYTLSHLLANFLLYGRLAINGKVLGSITASSDTVESEGRQMKQYWITYIKKKKYINSQKPYTDDQSSSNLSMFKPHLLPSLCKSIF